MMTGKRGPKISPEVKNLIMEQALGSSKKRTDLAVDLETMIETRGLRSPTIETMEKLISKIRNDRDSQDRPWSVAALSDYEIPPDALLIVMKAWAKELDKDSYLTIREVKWIARLYAVYPNLKDLPKVSHFNDIMFEPEDGVTITARDVENEILDDIIKTARGYANQERAIKLTGTYPHNLQDAVWLWSRDAGLYHAVTGDMRILENYLKLFVNVNPK